MRILTILLVMMLSTGAHAQDVAFVAIDVAGDVTRGDHKKVQIGTTLNNNEAITVAKGGSVTLACQNSGYAHFEIPGRYLVSTNTYCRAAPSAAIAKLCRFAWKQITHHEAHDDWRNHLDNMGAASRGGGCAATVDRNISEVYYYDGDFILMAKPKEPNTLLYLNVYKDDNSAPFLHLPLNRGKIELSTLAGKLDPVTYLWNIAPDGIPCAEYNKLHIIFKKTRDSVVIANVKELSGHITDPAESQYMLGYLMENLHYFADAHKCYKDAAKLGFGEKRYEEGLSDFEKRYGLK